MLCQPVVSYRPPFTSSECLFNLRIIQHPESWMIHGRVSAMPRIEVSVTYAVSASVSHLACTARANYGSSLADRPPREDLPLPTSPPYTAFIGNLAFDVTDSEMASFFGGHEV